MEIDLTIISLIANIILIVTFTLSMLLGFLKGFKKSLINLIANIIVLTLILILTNVIAKSLSNIDVSSFTNSENPITFAEFLKNKMLENIETNGKSIEELTNFTVSITIAVLRLPAYILLMLIGFLIIKPLLKLLLKAFIPIGSGKTMGFRFIGLGISFVSYIIVMFFITAPIFGTVGIVKNVADEIEDHKQIDELNKGIALGTASLVFGDDFGLQREFVGKLIEIETDHGILNINKESENHKTLISVLYKNADKDESAVINEIILNYDEILVGFSNSNVLEIIMPIAVEIIQLENSGEIEFDFSQLENVKWSEEKTNIINVLTAICEFAEEVNLDFENANTILSNPNLPNALKEIGTTINTSGLLKDIVLVYLNDLIQDTVKEQLGDDLIILLEVIDLTKLDLVNDFEKIGQILNTLATMNVFNDTEFNVLENINQIEMLINQLFSLSTIDNNEREIIEAIISFAEIEPMLNEIGLTLNFENIEWDLEIKLLTEALTNILTLIKNTGHTNIEDAKIIDLLMDENNTVAAKEIIENLAESQLVSGSLISVISKVLETIGLSEWKSDWFNAIESKETIVTTEWIKEELFNIIDVYRDAEIIKNINFSAMTEEELENLETILLKINKLNIISLDNALLMINDALAESNISTQVLSQIYNHDNTSTNAYNLNKNEWESEIPRLINIIKRLNNITINDNIIWDNTEGLAEVLELMKTSYIFGNDVRNDNSLTTDDDIFNKLIIEILTDSNIISNGSNNGFINLEEALRDDWSKYNYTNELAIIKLYDSADSVQNDDVIGQLQSSEIIKKYFDIASIVNEKIDGVVITIMDENVILKDCVNDGNTLTNDDLKDLNWEKEIEDVNTIVNAFSASDAATFKQVIDSLSASTNDTYAVAAAKKIKEKLANIWELI